MVLSDAELQPEPYLGDPDADRAAQRTARRAQVRRERQREAVADEPSGPAMLVLSADEASCAELCALLRAFGFSVQVMAQAPGLAAPWPFVAVFIAMPITAADGGNVFNLCNQVRESSRLPGETKPLLVLATQQLSATDRVRAGLAGCQEILLGAATRGGVAQLLDARGIAAAIRTHGASDAREPHLARGCTHTRSSAPSRVRRAATSSDGARRESPTTAATCRSSTIVSATRRHGHHTTPAHAPHRRSSARRQQDHAAEPVVTLPTGRRSSPPSPHHVFAWRRRRRRRGRSSCRACASLTSALQRVRPSFVVHR